MSRFGGLLLRLDELFHRTATLEPVGDPVADQLWSQLSDGRRDVLRTAAWLAHPVDDPAEARVVLALMDAREIRQVADRRWWILGGVVLFGIWAVLFAIASHEARFALLVVLIGGLCYPPIFWVVARDRRGLSRQVLAARASHFTPDEPVDSSPA